MRDYPLPSYALSIWLAGDNIMLGVPPRDGETKPHTLVLPLAKCGVAMNDWGTEALAINKGWEALLHILRERRKVGAHSAIGTPAEPVQYDLDKMLQHIRRYDSRGKVEVSLEDLGL